MHAGRTGTGGSLNQRDCGAQARKRNLEGRSPIETSKKTFPDSPRVGLVGHWGGNIGHELMTEGVLAVLDRAGLGQADVVRIEQHRPFSLLASWNPLRLLDHLHPDRGLRLKGYLNRAPLREWLWSWIRRDLSDLDLALTAGGPGISPHAVEDGPGGQNALIRAFLNGGLRHAGVPVAMLSLGSCFPWLERPAGGWQSENQRRYYADIISNVTEVTVRDPLAGDLLTALGEAAPLIADTGFVAGVRLTPSDRGPPPEGGYLVVNFQRKGANQGWGQGIDEDRWRSTFRSTVERLAERHEILFVCHSSVERELARGLEMPHRIVWPRSTHEYRDVLSGAAGGITTRLHATLPLAGVGAAPVLVGTDTRMLTADHLGIPTFFVKDVTADKLVDTVEGELAAREQRYEQYRSLREEALDRYAEVVRSLKGVAPREPAGG